MTEFLDDLLSEKPNILAYQFEGTEGMSNLDIKKI